jgi:hypothetical protein
MGAVDHRILFVAISSLGAPAPTVVTYAGTGMTLLYSIVTNPYFWVYYLVDPAIGANNVNIQFAAAQYFTCEAVSWSGVRTTGPIGNTQSGTNTLTIASLVGNLVVDFLGVNVGNANPALPSAAAGQTQRAAVKYYKNPECVGCGSSEKPGTTSVTMTWTTPGWVNTRLFACELRPFVITSSRAIKYILDASDRDVTLRDDQGSIVDPWDVEPDEWMNVNIPDLPTAIETDSFVDDSKKVYIEEVEYDDESGNLAIRNNRGQLLNVLMARLSGGGTI